MPLLPQPCPNCGQSSPFETRFCARCGAPLPQPPGAPPASASCGLAALGAVVGVAGVLAFFLAMFLAPGQRKPEEFDAWARRMGLTLLILALLGGVGLIPKFPGLVRGLGVGLIVGAGLAALLLGIFQGCAQSLHNI